MDEHLNPEQRIMSAHLTPREMVMLSKQRWEDVRQMHAQGMSNSEMARRLEVDRKTVRKALREPWRAYSRARSRTGPRRLVPAVGAPCAESR